MCDVCQNDKVLLEDEVDNNNMLQWMVGGELSHEMLEMAEQKIIVHVDRGYLRLSDPTDNQCMDHGQRIKINYCPVCGEKL